MNQEEILKRNMLLKEHMLALKEPSAWDHTRKLSNDSISVFKKDERLKNVKQIIIIGQGTSLATANNAEYFFSTIAKVSARAVAAYQFRKYIDNYLFDPTHTLVIGVSCGGNTESVVLGVEIAKTRGALTMCLSHENKCKLADTTDFRVNADTRIEERIGVMAYSVSHVFLLSAAYSTAIMLGRALGTLSDEEAARWNNEFEAMLKKLQVLPELFDEMHGLAEDFKNRGARNLVVLGTGPNYGTMIEGALKICEFAWLFCSGEELEDFAHGRFREEDGNIPLLIIAPDAYTYGKTMDILAGCELSGTPAIVFTSQPTTAMNKLSEKVYTMPEINELLTPFIYVFTFWFFGWSVRDLDKELVGEKRFGLFASDINFKAHFDSEGNIVNQ